MGKQITAEKLRSIANYDPETGLFTRKNGTKAGTLSHHGYMRMKIDDKSYAVHRLAWLYMTGNMPVTSIDHVDGDKLNNRISNPREATRPWEIAEQHYTAEDNGLQKPWHGRVWLNPPYGLEAAQWLARLAAHGAGTALIFARTETEMFFENVWGKASALLFLKGRLHFHYVDGRRAAANGGAPSVLIAYGEQDAEILKTCSLPGAFVPLTAQRAQAQKGQA